MVPMTSTWFRQRILELALWAKKVIKQRLSLTIQSPISDLWENLCFGMEDSLVREQVISCAQISSSLWASQCPYQHLTCMLDSQVCSLSTQSSGCSTTPLSQLSRWDLPLSWIRMHQWTTVPRLKTVTKSLMISRQDRQVKRSLQRTRV